MKFDEAEVEHWQQNLAYIDKRFDQLAKFAGDSVDHTTRYLFLTNSGGAVAVLSFLGASKAVRQMTCPKIALGSFALGVILTGILLAVRYYRTDNLLQRWRADVIKFLASKLDWEDLIENDNKRILNWTVRAQEIIGWLAFGCFIVGAAIGTLQFFFGSDPPSQAQIESLSGLAQNLGLTNLITGTYMAGDITGFLGKWQTLVGSILGGVFALAVAFIVAMSARRREELASGMVVASNIIPVRVAYEALTDVAQQENVPEGEYPLWFSEKLVHSHPSLPALFDASVARIMPIDVTLAAHLALFQKIYYDIEIMLERLSEDFQYFHEHGDARRPREQMKADARIITRHFSRIVEHVTCAEHLISKLVLSKAAIWHRLKCYVYPNKKEKECLKLLKKGSS